MEGGGRVGGRRRATPEHGLSDRLLSGCVGKLVRLSVV